jgi:hypothetical protein
MGPNANMPRDQSFGPFGQVARGVFTELLELLPSYSRDYFRNSAGTVLKSGSAEWDKPGRRDDADALLRLYMVNMYDLWAEQAFKSGGSAEESHKCLTQGANVVKKALAAIHTESRLRSLNGYSADEQIRASWGEIDARHAFWQRRCFVEAVRLELIRSTPVDSSAKSFEDREEVHWDEIVPDGTEGVGDDPEAEESRIEELDVDTDHDQSVSPPETNTVGSTIELSTSAGRTAAINQRIHELEVLGGEPILKINIWCDYLGYNVNSRSEYYDWLKCRSTKSFDEKMARFFEDDPQHALTIIRGRRAKRGAKEPKTR